MTEPQTRLDPGVATPGPSPARTAGWLLILLSLAIAILPYAVPAAAPFAMGAQIAVLVAFAWVHGSARYGVRGMALFMSAFFVLSNLWENLSIETGFPFGFFEHLAPMGPKLFNVPLVIGPGYFGAGYLAWVVANLLLDAADRDPRASSLPALALVAALVVTGSDAVSDPGGATVAHAWAYRHGGGYYGVPLSNFGGWIVLTGTAFLVGGWLMLRFGRQAPTPQPSSWWVQAPILLAIQLLPSPLGLVFFPHRLENDPAGNVWNSAHIFEGTTVVALVSTLAFAVTAILIALRRSRSLA